MRLLLVSTSDIRGMKASPYEGKFTFMGSPRKGGFFKVESAGPTVYGWSVGLP